MRYIIFILFVIVLNATADIYPFNMSEKQYLSLSTAQKLKSWEQQAVLNASSNNIYGVHKRNKITVSITKGYFKYMKKGYYIPPFELAKYEVKKIPVYSLKNNHFHHNIWVSYQDIGLYLGIQPHRQYARKDKYISKDADYFNKLTYSYKPAIIVKNNRWKKGINKQVSFKGSYSAQDLNVKIHLKTKKQRVSYL